jgi:hypothetical protein
MCTGSGIAAGHGMVVLTSTHVMFVPRRGAANAAQKHADACNAGAPAAAASKRRPATVPAVRLQDLEIIGYDMAHMRVLDPNAWPPWSENEVPVMRGAGHATVIVEGGAARLVLRVEDAHRSSEGGRRASVEIAAEMAWAIALAAAGIGNIVRGGAAAGTKRT